MNWWKTICNNLRDLLVPKRPPDFYVGGKSNPYLCRWYLVPRNPIINVYLHRFLRSDDDRALHDHPWVSLSVALVGEAVEETIAAGGVHHYQRIEAGCIRIRRARFAHRLELPRWDDLEKSRPEFWTLFITGPRMRVWGFHCPRGWVDWKRFSAAEDRGQVGLGCDQ